MLHIYLMLIFLIFVIIFFTIQETKRIKQLEKGTEEYKKTKKYFLKFNIVMIFLYAIEVFLSGDAFSFHCACCHFVFNTIPFFIFMILQFIVNYKLFKRCEKSELDIWLLIIYFITSIVLFYGIGMLSGNIIMNNFHTAEVLEY